MEKRDPLAKTESVLNIGISVACVAVWVLVLWSAQKESPLAAAKFWRVVAKVCQRLAREVGQVGIGAEVRYWRLMERVRG